MTQTDRISGLGGYVAIKPPVVAATTANITLSGEQTIDGVAVVADDRVLVKNQNTGSENGIYIAATGAWSRALDFDGDNDVLEGTLVHVVGGTTNGSQLWALTTADPIIGTSSLTFSAVLSLTDAPVVIETNSSSAALRVTQTGSGEALRVEDSANPDSSAFVIDATGAVTVGSLTLNASDADEGGQIDFTGGSGALYDWSIDTYQNTLRVISELKAGGTSVPFTATGGGGVQIGSPTGGDKGSGTLNATAFYQNGTSVREPLSANRTYYVRTDGSDSNTGLANTAGGAFLTLQKAWDVIAKTLDLAGYTATIQVADGTYTAGINATVSPVGGTVVINGNSGTPANVIVSVTSNQALYFQTPCYVTLQNFEIRTTTSGFGVIAALGAFVAVGTGMRFGTCVSAHLYATDAGIIYITTAYTIVGGSSNHYAVERNGTINGSGLTVTSSGTFSFSSSFALASTSGTINLTGMTYSGGTVTGVRYSATLNGVINTNGGGANYFPGNSAGSTATGGQYA